MNKHVLVNPRTPWIEKYRPQDIVNIILDDHQSSFVKIILQELTNGINQPIIFTGTPGIGKTTTSRCIARKILGENFNHTTFLEINGGDSRRISTMKEDIPRFCNRSIDYKGTRVIVFDEADGMTDKCQMEIKNYINQFKKKILFMFTCNVSSKIIADIQSTSRTFQFLPLTNDQVYKYLSIISKNENVEYTDKGLRTLSDIAEGDMRKGINYLHACYSSGKKVTPKLIYDVCNIPNPVHYREIIDACQNKDLEKADEIMNNLIFRGYNLIDIVIGLSKVLETYPDYEFKNDTDDIFNKNIMRDKYKILLSQVVSETKVDLVSGLRTHLQIRSMICKMILVFEDLPIEND